jgi:hypothetical protein
MKYIEELEYGSTFEKSGIIYLLTSDFKNGYRKAHSLKDGSSRWFADNEIVKMALLYLLDEENNFVAVKETKKDAQP